jgi:TonB-linked SusC/RagA family outer membrane protein
MASQALLAQGIIKGRVLEDDGDPAQSATIRVKGTNRGAYSDNGGNFSIVANDGEILLISLIGNVNQEVAAANGMVIKLKKKPTTNIGGDNGVVVTAQMLKKEKRSLGVGSTTITGDKLGQGQDRNVLSGLAGKVAGVNITNTSGSPGGSTRVVIRGGSSIQGNNQALIVVDGVMMDNGSSQNGGDNLNNQIDAGNRANDINPDDIESVTVLKGPSAAVLYGSRGANGAIIYTTKKGKAGTGKRGAMVTYNADYSMQDILKFPEFQNKWGQGYGGATHTEENWSWGPEFDGKLRPWGNVVDGKQKIKPFVALPNNVQDFFDRGRTANHSVNIAGGTDKSNFFASIGNLNNKGIVANSGMNRTSLRLNVGNQFSDKLGIQTGISYSKLKQDLFAQGQANNSFYDQIIQTPRDIPMRELKDLSDPFNTLEGYYGAYTINPYYVLENYKNKNNVDRLTGNIDLTYKPTTWLTLLNRTTSDFYTDVTSQYEPRFNVDRDDFAVHIKELGEYSVSNNTFNELNNDLIGSTKQDLTKNLDLNALVGFNIRQTKLNSSFAATQGGLIANDWLNLDNTADTYLGASALSLNRQLGVYSELGFGYNDYLYLNLSARNEWSSTLPANKNSYFYPGANMSFVLTDFIKSRNEAFDGKYLTYAKLRAGTARVGNATNPYGLLDVFTKPLLTDGFNNSQITFPVNGVPGVTTPNNRPNPGIRPEIIVENEIGAELGFFKNRLTLDASIYKRNSRDLILDVSLGGSTGYSSTRLNAGKITNSGVELAFNARPISTKSKFTVDVFGTYTKNKSNVSQLDEDGLLDQIALGGPAGTTVVAALNNPYGAIYTRGFERAPDGRVICDPSTGMPILTTSPKLFGAYNPDWMASWGSDIAYKGIKLHALFFHKHGGVFFSRNKNILEFVGTSATSGYNDRKDFVVPNSVVENPDGTFSENTTKVNAETFWTEQSNGEMNILSATFTKLREAGISYSLPKSLMSKTRFGACEIGLYGNNLALWLPKTKDAFGFNVNTIGDPEISGFGTGNVQGIEFGTVPSLKNYGINLKLTF